MGLLSIFIGVHNKPFCLWLDNREHNKPSFADSCLSERISPYGNRAKDNGNDKMKEDFTDDL